MTYPVSVDIEPFFYGQVYDQNAGDGLDSSPDLIGLSERLMVDVFFLGSRSIESYLTDASRWVSFLKSAVFLARVFFVSTLFLSKLILNGVEPVSSQRCLSSRNERSTHDDVS